MRPENCECLRLSVGDALPRFVGMSKDVNEQVQQATTWIVKLRKEIGKVIVGQEHLVDRLLVGLLAKWCLVGCCRPRVGLYCFRYYAVVELLGINAVDLLGVLDVDCALVLV